jgi:hypothetical protein
MQRVVVSTVPVSQQNNKYRVSRAYQSTRIRSIQTKQCHRWLFRLLSVGRGGLRIQSDSRGSGHHPSSNCCPWSSSSRGLKGQPTGQHHGYVADRNAMRDEMVEGLVERKPDCGCWISDDSLAKRERPNTHTTLCACSSV